MVLEYTEISFYVMHRNQKTFFYNHDYYVYVYRIPLQPNFSVKIYIHLELVSYDPKLHSIDLSANVTIILLCYPLEVHVIEKFCCAFKFVLFRDLVVTSLQGTPEPSELSDQVLLS